MAKHLFSDLKVSRGWACCVLYALCSALCCGEFSLFEFLPTSVANSLPKLTSNGKIANSCFFLTGGRRKGQSGRVERNISTHKTFMRRTISGLASAELKRVKGGEGGRQLRLNSWQIALCTPLSAACHASLPPLPLSAAR